MRFSDALILGSTTGHQLSNRSWECCFIGMGVSALTQTQWAKDEAIKRWPWLLNVVAKSDLPSELRNLGTFIAHVDGFIVATFLCDYVVNGKMTLERAVDIIRSIEPADDPTLEPQSPVVETTQEVTK